MTNNEEKSAPRKLAIHFACYTRNGYTGEESGHNKHERDFVNNLCKRCGKKLRRQGVAR
jgi:hypothetical protein